MVVRTEAVRGRGGEVWRGRMLVGRARRRFGRRRRGSRVLGRALRCIFGDFVDGGNGMTWGRRIGTLLARQEVYVSFLRCCREVLRDDVIKKEVCGNRRNQRRRSFEVK